MSLVRENSSIPAHLRTYGDMATIKMFKDTKANGGTTVSLDTFKVPAKRHGYFVGAARGINGQVIASHKISAADFSLKTLRQAFGYIYGEHHTRATLEAGHKPVGAYIGTWAAEDGTVHVDAVNWTSDRAEAVRWGVERGELAIYDVAANGSLYLSGTAMEMVA